MMERVDDHPPYPSGLRLAGRRVVVVGGGHVAQRRVPALLAAGADVAVVSPRGHAGDRGAGRWPARCAWSSAASRTTDLDGAWYVIAATDDPAVNERGRARPPRRAGSSASAPTTRTARHGVDPGRRAARRA